MWIVAHVLAFICLLQTASFSLQEGSCEVRVGNSDVNTKSATVSAGCVCPKIVNQNNWLGGHSYSDSFEVTQLGTDLKVQRKDSVNGWGMNLAFMCYEKDKISSLIWEQETTRTFISHNGKKYQCDVIFEFSVNNLTTQFNNSDSKCSEYESGESYMESLGKHTFVFYSSFGFRMDCSVNVAMANEALVQPVIEDSLHCIATNNCLSGWTSLATGCYRLVEGGSHQNAMTNCQKEGGYLVEINSQEEQNALVEFLKERQVGRHGEVWLGGSDEEREGQWIGNYSGQEIMKFNSWRYGHPSGGFDDNCVQMRHYKWDDCACSDSIYNYMDIQALCEYPNQNQSSVNSSTKTVDVSDSCGSRWTSLTTGCYRFVKAGSYREATKNCEKEGGYLVEIETPDEQNALAQFLKDSHLRERVLLGGSDEEREGRWMGSYSGKEIMKFNGWCSTYQYSREGLYGNCIYTDSDFKWIESSCYWKGSAAALCEKYDHNQTITKASTGEIASLTWEQVNTSIFIIDKGEKYQCDLKFEFSVNNISLIVQFNNSNSECSDNESGHDYIESLGKHLFMFTSSSGLIMDCSVNVAMAYRALSQPVIDDSVQCIATNNCLTGWTSLATGCYRLVKADSYQNAMTNCQKERGYLVEINSEEEQEAVVEFLKDSELRCHIWLGGSSCTHFMYQYKWETSRCSYKDRRGAALCEYPNQNEYSENFSTKINDDSGDDNYDERSDDDYQGRGGKNLDENLDENVEVAPEDVISSVYLDGQI